MPKETINADVRFSDAFENARVELRWGAESSTVDLCIVHRNGTGETSYGTPLDRFGINKLIRVLRRARDQAYGRDE